MKLSMRSKMSLCQFLRSFKRYDVLLLLEKYELSTCEIESHRPKALRNAIIQASDSQAEELVQELARKHDSMRTGVDPFGKEWNEPAWKELCLCLNLDGYMMEQDEYDREVGRFIPIEPIIDGATPVEDDLTREIQQSDIPDIDEILQVVEKSASAFRNGDFNGCLNNARVALQTLAKSIAQARLSNHAGNFNPAKWGEVIAYLRTSGFITEEQERGIAGLFGFLSPGSHTPILIGEEEFARLGRNLSLSICYFLVKQFNAIEADS